MEKSQVIQSICEMLLSGQRDECMDFANNNYPFSPSIPQKRRYTRHQACRIFLRDGFIDRYSYKKLIFPGLMKILSIEFPDIFKYHKNGKMTDCHIIYWELFPTIDHLVPVTRGGNDTEDNWLTTSMTRNSAKANWTVDELGWSVYESGNLSEWDGLTSYFFHLIEQNPNYMKDKYINSWESALVKAIKY